MSFKNWYNPVPSSEAINVCLVWKVYETSSTLVVNWVFLGRVMEVGLVDAVTNNDMFKLASEDVVDLGWYPNPSA